MFFTTLSERTVCRISAPSTSETRNSHWSAKSGLYGGDSDFPPEPSQQFLLCFSSMGSVIVMQKDDTFLNMPGHLRRMASCNLVKVAQ
ncbi:hypothetical protein CEXT_384411 [Caerostris extrusa]|uniref:Uncharacterized protein n=1 Tax=Caerostris extrusa TaxID=172846 RepID=A0AAV4UX05_CAEEX|nr:hypothetical protein CEXT_384411 [Caerostris extrusa]